MTDSIRVLQVGDDLEFSDQFATFVENEEDRFTVQRVPDVREAMERFEEGHFDCILSDLHMTDCDGIEFLEMVREKDPDFPFILATRTGSENIASEAISAGVTDYFQKTSGTYQFSALTNRIKNAVEYWWEHQQAVEIRDRLEAITENSTDIILTIDSKSTIRFVNAAVKGLLGYSPSELVGESATTLMPCRYRSDHLSGLRRYLKTCKKELNWQAIEFPALHQKGHEIPVSISFGEFVQNGERRFVGILHDISNRVRIEEELKEREEQFRQMAENIQEVIWMTDPEKDEMIYVNPAYEDVWGGSIESLYDNPSSFLDAIHPDDRDHIEAAVKKQADGDYDEKYRIIRPDGEIRWIHDRAVPITNDAGEVYRIVGISSDITEPRESEQELGRLRDLLEHTEQIADVGGWEIDTETMEVFWTENLFEILGVSNDVEPPLEGALDVYHQEDRPLVEEAVKGALQDGESFDVEARFPKPNGEIRWLRIQGVPEVRDDDVVTLRGAVQDITERKGYERTLERQNDRLEEFASVISHDLRNPLSLAEGRLELVREEYDSEHLESIENALNRIERIIEDVLWLARSGRDIGATEPVELDEIIETAWEMTAGNIEAAALVVSVVGSEGMGVVEADEDRICQLLENLFRNSIDHGGENVTVEVGNLENGIFIEDDGPGIPEEDYDNVFDAGYSTSKAGTGFGLSIAKRIVEAHGWKIGVTSGSTGGARFEISGMKQVL